MLKTDAVIKLLKSKKTSMSFNDIWNEVKANYTSEKNTEEYIIKSDLYISMIEDNNLIMLGGNVWDISNNYSKNEIQKISKDRITIETEIKLEKSDDTKELNLKNINKLEEE